MTYLNGETVVGQDLAVWIKTAAHHHPNDEDRSYADLTTGGTTGVTLMHWSGFKMEPRNFFPHNPLGGPVRCGT
jgi:Cu2+-containing amine oxidase